MKFRRNKGSFQNIQADQYPCLARGTCVCESCNGTNRNPSDGCNCNSGYIEDITNPNNCILNPTPPPPPPPPSGNDDQCQIDLDCILGICDKTTKKCIAPTTPITGAITNETNGEIYCAKGFYKNGFGCIDNIWYCSSTQPDCNCGFGNSIGGDGNQQRCQCVGNSFQVGGTQDVKTGSNQCVCSDGYGWQGEFDSATQKWKSGSCVELKKIACTQDQQCGDGWCVNQFCQFPTGCKKDITTGLCNCPSGTKADEITKSCVKTTCKDDPTVCNGDLMNGTCDPTNQDKCACGSNSTLIDGQCVCNKGYVQQGKGQIATCQLESCTNSGGDSFCLAGICQNGQCKCADIENLRDPSQKGQLQPVGQKCECKQGYRWDGAQCKKQNNYHLYQENPPNWNAGPFMEWLNAVFDGGYTDLIMSFYGQGGSPEVWEKQISEADKTTFINKLKKEGKTLRISVGGQNGGTIERLRSTDCKAVAKYVIDNKLQGVDYDLEPFVRTTTKELANEFVDWAIKCTKDTRQYFDQNGCTECIISHAPVAPYFVGGDNNYCYNMYKRINDQVGEDIDYYLVQFYNQGIGVYETYDSLFIQSPSTDIVVANSSVKQLNEDSGIPMEKIIVGKYMPGQGSNGYVDPQTLGQWEKKFAATNPNFPVGFMVWTDVGPATGSVDWLNKFKSGLA